MEIDLETDYYGSSPKSNYCRNSYAFGKNFNQFTTESWKSFNF